MFIFSQYFLQPRIYLFTQFLSKVLIRFLCLAFKSLEIGILYINIVIAVVTGHVLFLFSNQTLSCDCVVYS